MYKKDNRSCRMVSFILLLIAILTFFVGCEKVQKTENGEGTKDGEGSQGENENTEYIITQHSDDYYIKWAVPDIGGFDVKDEWIDRLNAKLEAEGYQFGIKLIRIKQEHGGNETITEYENYHNKVSLCGADIVFTGEEPVGKNYAESAMINGEYMDLTDKIRNSQIYELQPEVIWDSISYDGKIFMLPSETMQDGLKLMLLADSTCKNIMEKEYHGNLLELEHIVSPENKFFYTFADLSFAVGFGYYYDSVRGVIITKDGRIANPFEIDDIVEWMQMVNRWYLEGSVRNREAAKGITGCKITMNSGRDVNVDGFEMIDSWKQALYKRYKCSTAIMSDSDKKDEAFKMLELLRTDHNYANLLIYGIEDKKEAAGLKNNRANHDIFCLGDGIINIDTESFYLHFDSVDEKKRYYEENVTASPSLYYDLPIECSELEEIIHKYLLYDNILFSDSFVEKLEQFKTEYTEAFDRILKDYK